MMPTNMERRLSRLEETAPGIAPAVRVVFTGPGQPDLVVDPPLRANENLIVVNFVRPTRM
jgi:hypothetical protein